MLRVTVDSTVLHRDMQRLRQAAAGFDVEILATTVTLRERGLPLPPQSPMVAESGVYDESFYDSGAVYAESPPVIHETAVLGEWRLGLAVLGDDDAPSRFDAILAVIGDGSFPTVGERRELSKGQRHQLRDAMILEAHAREGRDVLISDDRKAFVGPYGSKRRKLEALCATRIMTVGEFCERVSELASRRDDRS